MAFRIDRRKEMSHSRGRTLVLFGVIGFAAFASLSRVRAEKQVLRPMTIDDLIATVRVADPQLSPDGRRVAFVRTTTALDTGTRNADIWVVASEGSSPPAPLVTGEKSEMAPRFLPDGRRIAFISTRDGAPQVYVADADGGGVRAITKFSAGVQPPLVVSPDGRYVAFVVDVFASCADEACNQRMRDAAEKDPVKMRRLTSLPYRHWDEWRENVRHHVFVSEIATGMSRDLTPGDFDSPPHFYEDAALAWSPDGRTLAFVSNREGRDREMWTTNQDIWVVPVTGGAATKVTTNPAADVQPAFLPDGRAIVYRSQRRAGFESDRWYLTVQPIGSETGKPRTVFESPDLSVDDFRVSPDGRTIWFTAAERGATNLYTVAVSGGTPKLVAAGGTIGEVQVGADLAVFSKSTLIAPADLFRVGSAGAPTRLTNENAAWLTRTEMPKPESPSAPGAAGASIQYWLLKPPGFDATKKYPVVFLI